MMPGPQRFIGIWLATLFGLLALTVAINWVVDPYEVFGTPRIAWLSGLKPNAKNHAMLAKTYQLARVHPATVVIGSSPVYLGIDAFDPAWPAAMRPVFNYGIPGGYATSTSLQTLREAIALGGVRNAVVFLDFQNFLVLESPAAASTEDDRRFHLTRDGRPNPARPRQVAADMFLSLATMGSLLDSITTVLSQRTPGLLDLAADGSATEADFINAARVDGMHTLFAQKDAAEAERASRLKLSMATWQGGLPNLDIISAVIALCRANGVKLTLVIAPHHADAQELYWRAGLWPRIEQLKTELATLAAGSGDAVVLWDFMDYSPFSTEPVPREGDRRTATHWFWEPTHFKKPLGKIMIERMFGTGAPPFGSALTPADVLARNAAVRAERHSLICDGTVFLTALPALARDDCARAETGPKPRGPT
jgi:hypothetical protein